MVPPSGWISCGTPSCSRSWMSSWAADVSMASLLSELTADLSLNGGALANVDWLLHRFPGAVRTGEGLAIPLIRGLTIEQILEECRGQRIAVAASRVRYRRLEDILVEQAQGPAAS